MNSLPTSGSDLPEEGFVNTDISLTTANMLSLLYAGEANYSSTESNQKVSCSSLASDIKTLQLLSTALSNSPESSCNSVSTPDSGIGETGDSSPEIKANKKRKNQPPDGNLLPPCRVCGEKASGLHYGANTCEPCKGFFRRSLVKVSKKNGEYKCVGDGNCKLGTGKRKMCSHCRYKKCLEVGMSQEAIKIGRYTYEKKTNDIKEVKNLKQKQTLMPTDDSNIHGDETVVQDLVETLIKVEEEFSDDFRKCFEPNGLLDVHNSVYERYKLRIEIFGNLGALPWSVYEEFHSATGIELDDRKTKMSMIAMRMEDGIKNMITFARHIPGFSGLCIGDQLALLKGGFLEYWFLGFHTRLNTDLKVLACNCKVMTEYGVTGGMGAHYTEMSSIMDTKYIDMMFEYAANMQKCHLTVEEVTLARGLVLTFPDRCSLTEPDKVEKIQWNLVTCLQTILKKNHKNPNQRLWQIFDKFVMLRNFTEHGREVDRIRSKWPVMKDHPLVLEMINPDFQSSVSS